MPYPVAMKWRGLVYLIAPLALQVRLTSLRWPSFHGVYLSAMLNLLLYGLVVLVQDP